MNLLPPRFVSLLSTRGAARSIRKAVKEINHKFKVAIDQIDPNRAACATTAQEMVETMN